MLIQEKFSEALSSLRVATNEAKIEINYDLSAVQEENLEYNEQHSNHSEGNFESTLEIPSSEKISNEIDIFINIEREKEEEEKRLMLEEDQLSLLLQNWILKEIKMKKDAKIKEIKRIEQIEINKKQREEYIKKQEKELAQKEMEEKLKQDLIKIEMQKQVEAKKQQDKEFHLMKIEDNYSKKYNDFQKHLETEKTLKRE